MRPVIRVHGRRNGPVGPPIGGHFSSPRGIEPRKIAEVCVPPCQLGRIVWSGQKTKQDEGVRRRGQRTKPGRRDKLLGSVSEVIEGRRFRRWLQRFDTSRTQIRLRNDRLPDASGFGSHRPPHHGSGAARTTVRPGSVTERRAHGWATAHHYEQRYRDQASTRRGVNDRNRYDAERRRSVPFDAPSRHDNYKTASPHWLSHRHRSRAHSTLPHQHPQARAIQNSPRISRTIRGGSFGLNHFATCVRVGVVCLVAAELAVEVRDDEVRCPRQRRASPQRRCVVRSRAQRTET